MNCDVILLLRKIIALIVNSAIDVRFIYTIALIEYSKLPYRRWTIVHSAITLPRGLYIDAKRLAISDERLWPNNVLSMLI